MVNIDSNRIEFIEEEDRWEVPYDDNVVREGRNEYYVTVIGRSCDVPNNHHPDCSCDGIDMETNRHYRSVKITRNYETNEFVLYLDGVSIIKARWADTPSGQGPNGHKKVLRQVQLFARGWMAAEEEVPVRDIHLHSSGGKSNED